MSQDQPNQKNFNIKSALMGGVGAIALSLSLAACNVLPNSQKLESEKVSQENLTTQEQIDSRIIFARDYPEIFAVLKGREYKLEITNEGTSIQFPKTVRPIDPIIKEITDICKKNKDDCNLAIPFSPGASEKQIEANTKGTSVFIPNNNIFLKPGNYTEPKPKL